MVQEVWQKDTIQRMRTPRADARCLYSSVWVPYLRGEATPEVILLLRSLQRGDPVWLVPVILQEVLQGADGPDRFARWERVLGELPMIPDPDFRASARAAPHLYARCCWAGITPRSANDCLIAVHAIRSRIPLLHQAGDFIAIASVEPSLALVDVAS